MAIGRIRRRRDYAREYERRKFLRLEKTAAQYRECLEAIRDFEPVEVMKDEFAYDRMIEAYRDAARAGLLVARYRKETGQEE